jgi:inner membrane transporter RhtA
VPSRSRIIASMIALPIGPVQTVPAFIDHVALAAGVGVGVASSVTPSVCDRLAMARLARATCALLAPLLPATATGIGAIKLKLAALATSPTHRWFPISPCAPKHLALA